MWYRDHYALKDVDVINKIEFSARILTSNAGSFLLLDHTRNNGIFELIDHDLVFENQSTNRIKNKHIKTMLCGNLIGIEKLETIETLGCRYVIKGKAYPTLMTQVTNPKLISGADEEGQETTELVTSLNTWKKDRGFVVSRLLKNKKNRAQISFLDGEEPAYPFFVTNPDLSPEEAVDFYQKRGNSENYTKEAKF